MAYAYVKFNHFQIMFFMEMSIFIKNLIEQDLFKNVLKIETFHRRVKSTKYRLQKVGTNLNVQTVEIEQKEYDSENEKKKWE